MTKINEPYIINKETGTYLFPMWCIHSGCSNRTQLKNATCLRHSCGRPLGWNIAGKVFITCGKNGILCIQCNPTDVEPVFIPKVDAWRSSGTLSG